MATPTSDGVVSDVTLYGSNYIDSLLHGKKWGGVTGTGVNLTYSFGRFGSYYEIDYGKDQPWSGFAPLSDIQKNATNMALAAWSEIANITFTEVTDSETVAGDLRFTKSDKASPTAHAYLPDASSEAGDVMMPSGVMLVTTASLVATAMTTWMVGTVITVSLVERVTTRCWATPVTTPSSVELATTTSMAMQGQIHLSSTI